MKKNKILITGGAGFIGSNLVRRLLELNYKVVVIGREDIEKSSINNLKKGFEYFRIDLKKYKEIRKKLLKINPNIIINLAGVNSQERDPTRVGNIFNDNFCPSLNLYNACLGLDALRCVINMGSADEYGNNKVPFIETQKEQPISAYSLAKTSIKYLSDLYYQLYKLPVVVLRPFSVYGEYQKNHQFVAVVVGKCLRNESIDLTPGEQTRDFIYVQDLVSAMLSVINKPDAVIGETVNICTGKEIKIKEAAHLIKDLTKSKSKIRLGAIEYRKGDIMRYYGSYEKAKALLGWQPEFSYKQGLINTIKWQNSQLLK
ncbi:SDR family NAD(P)-dependent oxidoreductase [Candidatus Woesearchaeota archaeon]|nr:SDR family NAD(P)-dependent oxidoreductase [Candidatus Woesearchaeota archaeon]